ncbi:hypothetical protein CMO91_05540 [Candidatus Woesearchaeota archaeon]|nr:hypothetical protein [Candidatus Woesearchaeota archaeon]|tara:strand:+ start:616 stop:1488 length:873 start_codon:yes stop_codon:yes gene_type:complete
MDKEERILALAESKPVLPMQVAKLIGTDSLMASAFLSELVSKGLLRVSVLKVGSSPLYFLPNKREQLLNYLTYLNGKDRKTVELLKEKKILRDSKVEPLTRVSLRNVRDFALPLEVTNNAGKELFWKWFLLDDVEAEAIIKQTVEPKLKPPPSMIKPKKPKPVLRPSPQVPRALPKPLKHAKPKKVSSRKQTAIDFEKALHEYFQKNKISVLEKHKEGYTVEVDSPVGKLTYYCHPKPKKRISDADISNAYVQAQMHKLPALLVTHGELTKKADALLRTLKGVKVAKIGS